MNRKKSRTSFPPTRGFNGVRLRMAVSYVVVVFAALALIVVYLASAGSTGGLRPTVLWTGLVALGLAAALGWALARNLTRPLDQLTAAAARMARGDLKQRVRVTTNDEIGRLAATFNEMADQLEATIKTLAGEKGKLEAVLAGMADSVIAVDSQSRVMLLNPAAEKLFKRPEGDARGRYILEVVRNYELGEALRDALRKGDFSPRELALTLPSLTPPERVVQVGLSPLYDSSGGLNGVVAVLHDVTELRALDRMRAEFIANVSHELRTPVTSIKGFAETLLENPEDEATTKRFLGLIADAAERLVHLVDDLLTLARAESHEARLLIEAVPVSQAVEEAASLLEAEARAKQVSILVEIPPIVPPVAADRQLLGQVLINLLDNAVKYNRAGGTVTIRASSASPGKVRLEIADTGPGIPPEHLPRLFERFYRVDKARSRRLGGTGLGLAIVKQIAERLDGEVDVKSVPGEGSTFYLTLPAYNTPPASPRPSGEEASQSNAY